MLNFNNLPLIHKIHTKMYVSYDSKERDDASGMTELAIIK